MFYRARQSFRRRSFNRAIAGIFDTPPIEVKDAPWCIVSMVANGDIPIYLLALKSFYPKIGRGKVTAIVDRDMPIALRQTLGRHVVGLEFVILEDIATGACQRGGTWERLLYVLDRSEREYTVQLDADTLTVSNDLDEVVRCLETNAPFTISDGFELMPLADVAEEADATPSDYIGIIAERAFKHYSEGEGLRYVRGSSGFAGFSRGGFTRAAITRFHAEMERLIGTQRWREWGSEQCGSNFAIANSPGAVVLPRPEYASFTPRVPRREVKFFHFIGSSRYLDGYYAARGQEVIAKLCAGTRSPPAAKEKREASSDNLPFAFAATLNFAGAAQYLAWRALGQQNDVWVRLRSGPEYQLRSRSRGNNDWEIAHQIFVRDYLMPPVWIPPERVKLVVDLSAGIGLSCLYWLTTYWRAELIAFEPDPANMAQCRANLARNQFDNRATLYPVAAAIAGNPAQIADHASTSQPANIAISGDKAEISDIFELLGTRRIDILKIGDGGSDMIEDPRFGGLDVRALVVGWHERDDRPSGRAWCKRRLSELGFRTFPAHEMPSYGIMWGYRHVARQVERSNAD